MTAPTRDRRRRQRRGLLLPGVLVAVAFAANMAVVVVVTVDQRRDNDARTAVLEAALSDACHRQAANRDVLRDVVTIATASSSGVDLTMVPGFDDLDPPTQAYFRALGEMLASAPSATARREQLLAAIPDVTCPS